jgi:23S rRNA (adenine2503-C2)-methyltransferase
VDKKKLCGLTAEEIFSLIEPSGFTIGQAVLVAHGVYKKGDTDISVIGKISRKLKKTLGEIAETGIVSPSYSELSGDGSVKYLFINEAGLEYETVFIPDGKRRTVCISTQSGCRMGCAFCATGRYGFRGSLTAGEIVSQLISLPNHQEITHVVFMGMGEPMDNLENVLKACSIITAEYGLAVSPRNVTVSTVGIRAGVERFLSTSDCNLTLSLHSPFSDERSRFIPAEKANPAKEIISMMKDFPLKKKRRLSLAYIMMNGLNDTENHLEALINLIKDSAIRINLLHYHPSEGDDFVSSTPERMQYFKHNLVISGIPASIRKSRGTDISAACGLLAGRLQRK